MANGYAELVNLLEVAADTQPYIVMEQIKDTFVESDKPLQEA